MKIKVSARSVKVDERYVGERPAYLLQMKWPSLLVVACSPRASHEERNERSSAPHEKTSSELRLRLQLRRVWKLLQLRRVWKLLQLRRVWKLPPAA